MLDIVLSQAAGAFGLGEVGGLQRYPQGAPCSCGKPAMGCDLCAQLKQQLDAPALQGPLQELWGLTVKERGLFRFLLNASVSRHYAELSDEIYDTVFDQAPDEPQVLIDSSKNVCRAFALSRYSRHELYFLHLVRDGRGYLRSRTRRARVKKPESAMRYVRDTARWLSKNLLAELLLGRRSLTVRYEDFICDPQQALDRIGEHCGYRFPLPPDDQDMARSQLYEPGRWVDYRSIRLDPQRLQSQAFTVNENVRYQLSGGWLGALWGYGWRQEYLGGVKGEE